MNQQLQLQPRLGERVLASSLALASSALTAMLLLTSACASDDGPGSDTDTSGGDELGDTEGSGTEGSGTEGTGGTEGTEGSDTDASDTDANDTEGSDTEGGEDPLDLDGKFRVGINHGYPNSAWSDADLSALSAAAGCNSLRAKLPEYHLDQWGWEIELGDMQAYADDGKRDLLAFLVGPTLEHATAPADTPNWQLDNWAPRNLYEPIFVDGEINPDNYWADYVFQTVSTYGDYVKLWEVWNEPDWVSDWTVTQTWDTQPPTADQLPHFNADIFAYIRMLRVTKEAATFADPEAKIALGGIGWDNFLDAIVRYTDNPEGGAVTTEYPERGGAWFDIVSYHFYPHYEPANSSGAARAFVAKRDALAEVLAANGVTGKAFVSTESGASHVAIADTPSGPAYARNYIIKVMALAQGAGILGVDWFLLSDGEALDSGSENPYAFMGLYEYVGALAETNEAALTDTGVALKTYGGLLGEAVLDSSAAELGLPADVDGVALRLPDARAAWVLWAVAEGTSEDAAAEYALAVDGDVDLYAWDYAQTEALTHAEPEAGTVALSLTGAPWIIIESAP
ncbi:hypothetical protein G6O69_18010 [Pseudenhygromyxa sp. WMMC2535]|uniref:hypothetical protein n=1 Tax=Pseudenhygromyxa sp. WMMC2535 TaxID=2712867 RepID=UPI001553B22D|nr:hypothetical protein [Pseudenhygromyxa sp. WMMC2535]NVB39744.1 hypothetical protein [Pseudenhygromyxa sp. WMMC2535]